MATKTETKKPAGEENRNIYAFFELEKAKVGNVVTVSDKEKVGSKYPHWLPTWDLSTQHTFEHLPPFKHHDRGLDADPEFKSLTSVEGYSYKPLTPKLGLEVDGIQLSKLTDAQKNDLALLVEQRGVVVFRNQDFKEQSFDKLKEIVSYFGPLDVHSNSGSPLNEPNFHLVFKSPDLNVKKDVFYDSLNHIYWHSDVSYEPQPPGITFLAMLQTGQGGDTQFLDTIEIYDRLSPLLKEKLEGLQAVHSSVRQDAGTGARGGLSRKHTVESIHPLVRYHPVLKKKALFINRTFTTRILGLKREESDALLQFLFKHEDNCLDAHIRANWDENTVTVWDNRRVLHTATIDMNTPEIRHAFRVTSLAERPVGSKEDYESWTVEFENADLLNKDEKLNLPPKDYYDKYIAGL
ncbi:hypothetical protein CANINC_004959 [Pichia inconspicua]|uniref:TauD/TfdA-like domain-containing protein n=1 Tax=Pichia inconspicua TaxID=52247 RepID=A0A4T0WUK6_9ASCO|nr:hypothetical protein CANINC_004959 [[Candida] inconspicua]